jgi:hypothetical protein
MSMHLRTLTGLKRFNVFNIWYHVYDNIYHDHAMSFNGPSSFNYDKTIYYFYEKIQNIFWMNKENGDGHDQHMFKVELA